MWATSALAQALVLAVVLMVAGRSRSTRSTCPGGCSSWAQWCGGVRRRRPAVALSRPPLGGHRDGGLHPDRLVGAGAADRADVADPDRRPRRGCGLAPLRAGHRHGDDRVGRRRPRDRGLDKDVARRLVDELTVKADAVEGDAT